MRRQGLLAAGMVLATAAPAAAQDINLPFPAVTFPGVSLSSGIDYSSGRYGDPTSTDILVGLTSLRRCLCGNPARRGVRTLAFESWLCRA